MLATSETMAVRSGMTDDAVAMRRITDYFVLGHSFHPIRSKLLLNFIIFIK